MAKRKRDIFTVIEVVPNWFEAGEGTTKTSEGSEELSNWVTGHEDPAAYVAGEEAVRAESWVEGHEDQLIRVAGRDVGHVANWAQGTDVLTGRMANRGSNSGSTTQTQPTLADEVVNWLEAVRLPVQGAATELPIVTSEEVEGTENRTLNAFWSLLMDT